jgi:glycosyltransferase involved in cell wall biosynthesis
MYKGREYSDCLNDDNRTTNYRLPFVSILIPVYQVERYIERCARSVFEQTYPKLEFIFVDDDSHDASIDILQKVKNEYPNRKDDVIVIHHKQNLGLAVSRNTAVNASHGEFVFHVDSDDWVERDAVSALIQKQLETGADIVSAEADDYKEGLFSMHLTGGWDLEKKDLLIGLLTYKVSTTIWRRLIRKKLYVDYDVRCDENGSGGEDFQVLPRLIYYAEIVSGIEKCIYHHDLSNKNSITNNAQDNIDSQIQGLVSVRTVVQFFSNKESTLRSLVEGIEIRNIHYWMINNVVSSNRSGYAVFLRYLRNTDPVIWHYVRWDNSFVRLVESHYFSIKLLLFFRRLKSKIMR